MTKCVFSHFPLLRIKGGKTLIKGAKPHFVLFTVLQQSMEPLSSKAAPSSSTPREGDDETLVLSSTTTRLRRKVLSDDTSTHESQSQPSQSGPGVKKGGRSARSKARRNALSRKRHSALQLTESTIIKWAEEESKTHPESISELGQILMSIADTSPAAIVNIPPPPPPQIEGINWQEVARTVEEESKADGLLPKLNAAQPQRRLQSFSNPGCKPKTIVKQIIRHDDDDSPMIEDLPAEDETPDKIVVGNSTRMKIEKTETLITQHHSSEEKLESFSAEEVSSFLNSDIDSEFGKELSQEFKTLNVPISVPLSRTYTAHEPSSPEIDIENPVATPPPQSVKAPQTPLSLVPKTEAEPSCPNTTPMQEKPPEDGSKLQTLLSKHIRMNPLLARWTLHKQNQGQ